MTHQTQKENKENVRFNHQWLEKYDLVAERR